MPSRLVGSVAVAAQQWRQAYNVRAVAISGAGLSAATLTIAVSSIVRGG